MCFCARSISSNLDIDPGTCSAYFLYLNTVMVLFNLCLVSPYNDGIEDVEYWHAPPAG